MGPPLLGYGAIVGLRRGLSMERGEGVQGGRIYANTSPLALPELFLTLEHVLFIALYFAIQL